MSADQRITLVLTDASDGVQVLWAPLDVRTMEEAVSALGHREGVDAPFTAIGRYPARGKASPHLGIISAWAESKGLAGVVWTALKPGLDRKNRGSAPSLDQLRTHATGLTTEERMRAFEYVERAPAQIETPIVRRFSQRSGSLIKTGNFLTTISISCRSRERLVYSHSMKFLHSADWQLGKPYGRFGPDVRAALTEARFDAIDTLGRTAAEQGVGHVVVAGDIFDTEGPEDRTIVQAISRMSRHACRWWLLPGNHDFARNGGLWDRVRQRAGHGIVVLSEPAPHEFEPGVWLLPAPLVHRHNLGCCQSFANRSLHDAVRLTSLAALARQLPPLGERR